MLKTLILPVDSKCSYSHISVQVLLGPVQGNYDLHVRVDRYEPPNHPGSRHYCCGTLLYSRRYHGLVCVWTHECITTLLFCLRPVGTSRNNSSCNLGSIHTRSPIGVYWEFGSTIGGIDNPVWFESVEQEWNVSAYSCHSIDTFKRFKHSSAIYICSTGNISTSSCSVSSAKLG